MDLHSDLHKQRIDLVAFLGALCLFLSTVEYLFPKPIPFMRLGLANLPILVSLHLLPFPYLMLLTLVKVAGQGLINGTLASYVFIFSVAGSYSSVLVMYAVSRISGRFLSLVGVSLVGSLTSNAVQVLLSIYFIFGKNAVMIAPLFLGIGTVSGLLIGLIAEGFVERSRWHAKLRRLYAQE
ncbi:heptaprenyl diphosphate synthase [Marispirochaeta aestuarii]|uniref:Heptaprenyl diphosphate synthase n=1 Tax=Marispirochaeta aestuarii TaxID=1963862 RepID=A0A1Y1S379_9SPIO|nr:Gx transporter family protein [Marispirochaeta aestuarii]ORC37822.1 heptaprenyl diphosphate synthase [Marispirochaeta aestuarii]